MAEANQPNATNGKFHFHLIFPFVFSPRKVFQQVLSHKATWLTPLLVISLVLAGQAIFNASRSSAGVPTDMMPVEQMPVESMPMKGEIITNSEAYTGEGMTTETTSPAWLSTALAAGQKIGGLWLGWFVLTALLYVALVVSGGQNTFTQALNLTAWSSLPFAIQSLGQIIFALAYPASTSMPQGLAGLVQGMQGAGGTFLGLILQGVNIFLIWQAILMIIGITFMSQIPGRKAFWLVIIAILLYILLAALPGFGMAQLSTLQNAASPQY